MKHARGRVNARGSRRGNPTGSGRGRRPRIVSRRVVAIAYARDGAVYEHQFNVKTCLIALPNGGLYMPPGR